MSHHILHILKHGCTLSKRDGFIVCKGEDQENSLPYEDLRAVIIAAKGVTLTSGFMSAVLDSDGVILHCNEKYQPNGITLPLQRIADRNAYLRQAARPNKLNQRIWKKLLRGKTANQRHVLQTRGLTCNYIEAALSRDEYDEANCARQYWQMYFPSIGWASSGRDRKLDNPPNQMLNYGYSVLAALCHRSLLTHGLSPLLGVNHVTRYRTHPLVYDLMEPLRPAVDLMLAEFMVQKDVSMKEWCRKVGSDLREKRIQHKRYPRKLMDAIDVSASSMAQSYAKASSKPFWIPEL